MRQQVRSSILSSRREDFVPRLFTILGRGYSGRDFLRDLASGITVGIIALPLAMAFGIASGTTPERGLFTAVIAGFLISFLGGSRYQIGGPTGAFVVIVASVIREFGYEGLVVATLLAGILLLIMGAARLGNLIKYIPYPVTAGFTTGIGVLIFSSQLKDFLGLPPGSVPSDALGTLWGSLLSLGNARPASLFCGLLTVGVILFMRRTIPRIPAAIVAVLLTSAAAFLLGWETDTIGTRFGGIPSGLPVPAVPALSLEGIRLVFPSAVTIAMLAGIESLLSAVVADGMTGDRHRSNTELVAQGVANIASALFGGIPATGAIARTAANIKSGAVSPVSGIVHALVLLLLILVFAPLASYIPLASLAGILMIVAYDMSELRKLVGMLRAPKSDAIVMLLTLTLTVVLDLTVAVQVGVILAALLFMRRMSEVTTVSTFDAADVAAEHGPEAILEPTEDEGGAPDPLLPRGAEVYEINGPFFFGVADLLKDVLSALEKPPRVFILRMRHVHAVDATGLHALEGFCRRCRKEGIALILSGVQEQPARAIERMGLDGVIGRENITDHIVAATIRARRILDALETGEPAAR